MGLIVLDAGVVIALLDAADARHTEARRSLERARGSAEQFVLPASAYAEALVGPMRHDASSANVVDAFIDALPARIEPATRDIARRAAELRARHGAQLRLPDALVVATALALAADKVVTTDARWPRVGVACEILIARRSGERPAQADIEVPAQTADDVRDPTQEASPKARPTVDGND